MSRFAPSAHYSESSRLPIPKSLVRGTNMSFHSRIAFSLLILLGFSGVALAQTPGSTDTPTYLDQGWSETQRQQFYTTTQGSQLIPLAWFLALERPQSEELFVADGLSRFGFLP